MIADRVIWMDGTGYYCGASPYKPVPKDRATKMNRRRAESVRRGLRKLGYDNAKIEVIK